MRKISLREGWILEQVLHEESFREACPEKRLKDRKVEKTWAVGDFPAQVHDVLLAAGEIDNPNITGINKDTWTDEWDWVYRVRFAADPSLPARLSFGGLDTFCLAYLNGNLIGRYENVYRSYLTDEVPLQAENELVLYFFSAKRTVDETVLAPEEEGFVPKVCATRAFRSGFQYYCGPDPTLIRCGVYREVEVWQRETVRIAELKTDTFLSDDMKSGSVTMCVTLEGGEGAEVPAVLTLLDEDGRPAAESRTVITGGRGEISCGLAGPALWWPRTHGKPSCYRAVLTVGGEKGDKAVRTVGFRKLEHTGSLGFTVNGRPLRLWGANLEHPDTLSGVYRPERMERLLDLAEMANFNALRIWGESETYPEAFYDECDRRGILLWQDFYLCYAMYSEQPPFVEELRTEVTELVKSLRHHPSILLWCGGNEMTLSRDYDHPGHYCIGEKLIREVFPAVCAEHDPERYYHPTSPCGGRDANDPEHGDTHGYTHLWFVPGRLYPNFLSENCRVSTPALRSMKRMMTPEELWPAGYDSRITPRHRLPWPDTWSAHNSNDGPLKLGPVDHYYDAANAEELIYRIGAAHAEYIRRDVERFRRGYPAEGVSRERAVKGHLLWKFNNNSNIITYGVVDYFNEPYYPYYELKRVYAPLLLSVEWGDHAHVFLTNDTPERQTGRLVMQLFDMRENRVAAESEATYAVEADASVPVATLDGFGQFRKRLIVVLRAYSEAGEETARTLDWFETEKNMVFPEETGLSIRQEGEELVVTAERFARCVELLGDEDGDEFGFVFSDNYFDLLPGEEKRIRVLGDHARGRITAKAFYAADTAQTVWERGGQ